MSHDEHSKISRLGDLVTELIHESNKEDKGFNLSGIVRLSEEGLLLVSQISRSHIDSEGWKDIFTTFQEKAHAIAA